MHWPYPPTIIPLRDRVPLIDEWQNLDPGTYTDEEQNGQALVLKGRMRVLDFDSENAGRPWTQKLPHNFPMVRTHRGLHYYFLLPEGSEEVWSKSIVGYLPTVDWLGVNHLVYLPGTYRPNDANYGGDGYPYRDLGGGFRELTPEELRVFEDLHRASSEWLYLKKHVGRSSIGEGGRNNWITQKAGALYSLGFESGALLAALEELNDTYCKPPLDISELKHVIRQSAKWERPEAYSTKLFEESEELRKIYEFARATYRSPFALLACVLARISVYVDWRTCLSSAHNTAAQPGLYMALFGPPGTGKSSTYRWSEKIVPMPPHVARPYGPKAPAMKGPQASPSSGEGITKHLEGVKRTPKDEDYIGPNARHIKRSDIPNWYRFYCLAFYDEIENLIVRGEITPSLMKDIRSAFLGAMLDTTAGMSDRTRNVRSGHYNFGIVACGTEEHVMKIYQQEGGTSERFLYYDARVSDYLHTEDLLEHPTIEIKGFDKKDIKSMISEIPVRMPKKFLQWEDEFRRAAAKGIESAGDVPEFCKAWYHGGHTLLICAKLTHALAVLHGHEKPAKSDLDIAVEMMKESKRCRGVLGARASSIREEVRQAELQTVQDRGEADQKGRMKAADDRGSLDLRRLRGKFVKFSGTKGAWQRWKDLKSGKELGRKTCLEMWISDGGEE